MQQMSMLNCTALHCNGAMLPAAASGGLRRLARHISLPLAPEPALCSPAMYVRSSSATMNRKLITCSGSPANLARSTGS